MRLIADPPNFTWQFNKTDIDAVRRVMERAKGMQDFDRRLANLSSPRVEPTREDFWRSIVVAILSSQQGSGPESKLREFGRRRPFALPEAMFAKPEGVEEAAAIISDAGLRWGTKRAEFFARNHIWLETGGWQRVETIAKSLVALAPEDRTSRLPIEQEAADLMQEAVVLGTGKRGKPKSKKRGIGPKQARNIWQMRGLTYYEIPLDSRVQTWLNANGFPLPVERSALGGRRYYRLVLDGVQALCAQADVLPRLLDGAIFATADADEGEDEQD